MTGFHLSVCFTAPSLPLKPNEILQSKVRKACLSIPRRVIKTTMFMPDIMVSDPSSFPTSIVADDALGLEVAADEVVLEAAASYPFCW